MTLSGGETLQEKLQNLGPMVFNRLIDLSIWEIWFANWNSVHDFELASLASEVTQGLTAGGGKKALRGGSPASFVWSRKRELRYGSRNGRAADTCPCEQRAPLRLQKWNKRHEN